MRKLIRGEEPEILKNHWAKWGLEWEERHAAGANFYWHKVDGQPVNQLILSALKQQTQEHCSFCDNFPVAPPSIDTIDHFKPKAEYPREAFRWSNLFFCCTFCQRKQGDFSDLVLAPDTSDYEFDRYFRWDHTQGTLEVNEATDVEDQARAARTIEYFRLNVDHPTWRKFWLIRRSKLKDEPLDQPPYRDYIDSPSSVTEPE